MDPGYREVGRDRIPEIVQENGVRVKVICGAAGGVRGPVHHVVTDPGYLDVTGPGGAVFSHPTLSDHTVAAYVIEGSGWFDGVRSLLISGRPIREPVAWYGPVVMRTREELRIAMRNTGRGRSSNGGPVARGGIPSKREKYRALTPGVVRRGCHSPETGERAAGYAGAPACASVHRSVLSRIAISQTASPRHIPCA
jgi:hypothetical protein